MSLHVLFILLIYELYISIIKVSGPVDLVSLHVLLILLIYELHLRYLNIRWQHGYTDLQFKCILFIFIDCIRIAVTLLWLII